MHHHDKLEDTWHAANIRWHTHSHVSRVRSLNEQALQCVCVVQVRRQPATQTGGFVAHLLGAPVGCIMREQRLHPSRASIGLHRRLPLGPLLRHLTLSRWLAQSLLRAKLVSTLSVPSP